MAHYCLQELHILPSEYLRLSREERAFIAASRIVYVESRKKAMEEAKRGR